MKRFKKTFALNEKDIEPTCIVLPSNDRDLFASLEIIKSSRGLFYNTDTARGCSVISLKNRMFAGDCLLSLKDTNCSNIILFGSCGSFNLNPAEKVISAGAFNMESFTELLRSGKTTEFDFTNPDEKLSDNLRKYIGRGIGREVFATVSSLMLEEIKGDIIKSSGAGCVDMESSQVFAAAEHAGIRALGVFYVTDTVGKLSFYDRYPKETADKIKGARKSLANQLCGFIKDELSPRN